ncbi:transposase family protein, partial [Cryobacterium glaciale]
MRTLRIWRTLLGVENTFVEDIDLDLEGRILIASVRPMAPRRNRCGSCQKRSPRYDLGDGRRRWRGLNVGSIQLHLEADAPRVSCRVHGVTVAAVPWARHQSGHTLFFD